MLLRRWYVSNSQIGVTQLGNTLKLVANSFDPIQGSPLHKTENGKTKIIGLASDTNDTIIDENNHVVLCNGKFWYTRIGVFVDWIESWIGDEHC